MPCEGCNVQFTVFRRKRCCLECKRFYCSNCLTASTSRASLSSLCERCTVFAKRPLLKVDLVQLKPKDLIFYLQSKHISTAGCVEKDELVGLVLDHIQQADQTQASGTGNSSKSFDSTHSFDTLKQSCQNFFSNISEKVDSFSFESNSKQNKSQSQNNRRSSSNITTAHIAEQPRVSTREIPTYASFQNRHPSSSIECSFAPAADPNRSAPMSQTLPSTSPGAPQSSSPNSSQTCSPVVSNESHSPSQFATKEVRENVQSTDQDLNSLYTPPSAVDLIRVDNKNINSSASGCDCSDDEIITSFRTRSSIGAGDRMQSPQSSSSLENPVAGPSASSNLLTSTSTITKKSSPSLKIESYDESSESSFEELGAIGGTSDDSKTAADSSVQTSSDQWQFIDTPSIAEDVAIQNNLEHQDVMEQHGIGQLTVAVLQPDPLQFQRPMEITTRPKKVARRRSDGYLSRRRTRSDDDESPTSPAGSRGNSHCLREEDEPDNEKNAAEEQEVLLVHDNSSNCKRCGKNRSNIKRHVEKMRKHLENSQMHETEIKRELEEFLVYLEKRTKSLDYSDSEVTAVSSMSGAPDTNSLIPPSDAISSSQFFDENEGIHVYAAPINFNATMTDSRFINLGDYESLDELENLTVKQLKEVLMLNRVDYKGCCEKQELLERVMRLWKNLKSTPAIEKIQSDELCKICMDAPIECVILECGHMATCTSCGKVLSECPICRQYIVRVVRFFKA